MLVQKLQYCRATAGYWVGLSCFCAIQQSQHRTGGYWHLQGFQRTNCAIGFDDHFKGLQYGIIL